MELLVSIQVAVGFELFSTNITSENLCIFSVNIFVLTKRWGVLQRSWAGFTDGWSRIRMNFHVDCQINIVFKRLLTLFTLDKVLEGLHFRFGTLPKVFVVELVPVISVPKWNSLFVSWLSFLHFILFLKNQQWKVKVDRFSSFW